MSKLPQIISTFNEEGKAELPVAIIQNGTRADEKVGIGTVSTILKEVEKKQLTNPAIIIIGEVVQHRNQIKALQQKYSEPNVLN